VLPEHVLVSIYDIKESKKGWWMAPGYCMHRLILICQNGSFFGWMMQYSIMQQLLMR
jgi:hypothetical protein